MNDSLTIIETKTAVFVAYAHHPDDWIARFEKSATFPARDWAERMVALYQQQQKRSLSDEEIEQSSLRA